MNPKTISAQIMRVENEVRRIREAWPEAKARFTRDFLAAVVIIREPTSTYIIEVEPGETDVVTRSLWVSHRMPAASEWRTGWVD